ncbi:response regulator [Puia sp.]|jgi:two-component system cell cycle response regulator DivK|uniref:response regulator n=1 Tax=Puia sp. TaxID=2045100 RepID=UPI002F3F5ED5
MKKKILIFDDDADILEVCAIVLESNGFEVVTQNNCENLLSKVLDTAPDVVLMDNKIPPLGGIVATQEIKATPAFHRLPIVYFSANLDIARLAGEAGADRYIEKPFDLDALVLLLQQACGEPACGEQACGEPAGQQSSSATG